MNFKIEELKAQFKFIEEKKLKAIGSIDFGNFVIRGFRIMDSQYENKFGKKLWLTPPSYPDSGGRYHPIFFIPDKKEWEQIEAWLWDEYDKQSEQYYKKRFDLSNE